MTGQKRKYKTTKIKTFFFFLLLATVFWVLTKYSEETTALVTTQLQFYNLPNSVSISGKTAKEVGFYSSANGFQFLSYSFKKPITAIDMSQYYEEGDTVVLISGSELGKIINVQLGKETRVNNLLIEELPIYLSELVSKKVPVYMASEITFKEGYKLLDSVLITPDSVTVAGPASIMNGIEQVTTEVLEKKEISESMEGVLRIVAPSAKDLSISHSQVKVRLNVEEFTQKKLVIPVTLTNVPEGVELKLLPDNITISFDVAVSRFNSISENDFRIVCDYTTRSSEENIMVPKMDALPDGLRHIEWSTKKVEYLIFK